MNSGYNISNQPLVSVIVLTYNQEGTIARTLDHIISQKTNFNFEIIIGEDASPGDNTRAVCESYVEAHPQIIRLMPKAENKGIIMNLHDCLKQTSGRYIACCAGDDWWHNHDKLQIQADYLDSDENCVLVHSNAYTYNVKNKTLKDNRRYKIPKSPDLTNNLIRENYLIAPTVMFRRSMTNYIDLIEYKNRGYLMEDYPMWLDMSLHGTFHYMPIATATYSVNEVSISNFIETSTMARFALNVAQVSADFLTQHPQINSDITETFIYQKAYRSILRFATRHNDIESIKKYKVKLSHLTIKDRYELFKRYIIAIFKK